MEWRVRAIRGATTAAANTPEAIREAVAELLDDLEARNQLDPAEIVSVVFTATRDLDAVFPASIARARPCWNDVPLLDVQQMHVPGAIERCIRILLHVNTPLTQHAIAHSYLRNARRLRPDWTLAELGSSAASQL